MKEFTPFAKIGKLKIFSTAFSVLMALQAFSTPVHAGYNKLMKILEESDGLTVENIRTFTESHPNHNFKETFDGESVLYYAIFKGENTNSNRTAIAKYLVQECGVPVVNSSMNWHAYAMACQKGMYNFASWLLKNYFDTFNTSPGTDTAAHLAARFDRVGDLEYIINRMPRLLNVSESTITNYKTPLYVAVENGSANCVRWLLEHGATIPAGKPDLLKVAKEKRHEDVVNVILAHQSKDPAFKAKVRSVDGESGDTPLHIAVRRRDSDEVERLVMAHADPNVKNKDGQTPLHLAAGHGGDIRDLVTLLRARPNFRITDKNGNTPLHLAAEDGWRQKVEILLDAGADPNVPNAMGNTPVQLLMASRPSAFTTSFKELTDKKADLTRKDKDGRTLLHLLTICSQTDKSLHGEDSVASCRNYSKCVEKLVEHGLDINAVDNDGYTPLDYCQPSYLRELMKEQGAESNRGLIGRGLLKVTRKANSIIHFFD